MAKTKVQQKIIKRKKLTQVTIDRILSIKVSDTRFNEMKSGRHFEFTKVKIPASKQGRLRIGDTIYANSAGGKSRALEFLSMDQQKGYDEDQVDVIVKVI
ncbi:hypothetical protein KJ966_03050 [bacterium]|nr:hypothetical protein [bacterium]